ncbi:MAG: SCO family protein, partial [bacterium]
MTVRTLLALVLAALGATAASRAQQLEAPPAELDGVGITERLDAALPLDLAFLDERGETVALGQYFEEGRPVVLNLVYFDCPMLCNVFLDGLVTTLRELDWTPGKEFRVVTVSIDPTDGPEGARAKRGHYVARLGRPEAEQGWHFLTGSEENVRRLADAVGFAYRYDEERREYMHSAALFVATPEGRLSRYLYGVAFDATTLRLSLVEASEGRVGSAMDQLLLFCFAYDHTAGRYGPAALKLVRAFGAVTACALGLFLATHWR